MRDTRVSDLRTGVRRVLSWCGQVPPQCRGGGVCVRMQRSPKGRFHQAALAQQPTMKAKRIPGLLMPQSLHHSDYRIVVVCSHPRQR